MAAGAEDGGATPGSLIWPVEQSRHEVAGKALVRELFDNVVVGLNLADGTVKWRKPVKGGIVSTVALSGDLALATATDGKVRAFDLVDGSQRWNYDAGAPLFAPPAVVGGVAYVGDLQGVIHAIDLTTGTSRWKLDLATDPPWLWGVILFVAMLGLFGLGNGAVFQLVPQRFPKEIGVLTGIVGAAGGAGGFFLPTLLGGLKQVTATFAGGFLIFALGSFGCAAALAYVSRSWEGVFIARGGLAAIQPELPAPAFAET